MSLEIFGKFQNSVIVYLKRERKSKLEDILKALLGTLASELGFDSLGKKVKLG